MDYSKSGAPKQSKNSPRQGSKGADGSNNPYARPAPKAELLAKLKAAAEKGKKAD